MVKRLQLLLSFHLASSHEDDALLQSRTIRKAEYQDEVSAAVSAAHKHGECKPWYCVHEQGPCDETGNWCFHGYTVQGGRDVGRYEGRQLTDNNVCAQKCAENHECHAWEWMHSVGDCILLNFNDTGGDGLICENSDAVSGPSGTLTEDQDPYELIVFAREHYGGCEATSQCDDGCYDATFTWEDKCAYAADYCGGCSECHGGGGGGGGNHGAVWSFEGTVRVTEGDDGRVSMPPVYVQTDVTSDVVAAVSVAHRHGECKPWYCVHEQGPCDETGNWCFHGYTVHGGRDIGRYEGRQLTDNNVCAQKCAENHDCHAWEWMHSVGDCILLNFNDTDHGGDGSICENSDAVSGPSGALTEGQDPYELMVYMREHHGGCEATSQCDDGCYHATYTWEDKCEYAADYCGGCSECHGGGGGGGGNFGSVWSFEGTVRVTEGDDGRVSMPPVYVQTDVTSDEKKARSRR